MSGRAIILLVVSIIGAIVGLVIGMSGMSVDGLGWFVGLWLGSGIANGIVYYLYKFYDNDRKDFIMILLSGLGGPIVAFLRIKEYM